MDGKIVKENDYKTTATPKAVTNDGIPVFCSHDEIVPTKNLKPNPLNPNNHPQEQIELLKQIIEKTGWRQPITVSNRSGLITKGHGRLQAAKFAGWSNVPVDYQDYSNQDEEYADLIADNRLAELSNIDNEMLSEMIGTIENEDILSLTGYDEEDIEALLSDIEEEEEQEEEETPKDLTPFAKAGDVWQLGEHRLIVGEDDPVCDGIIANYVYETGNLGCTCTRDGKEYGYMELVTSWSVENGMEADMFKMRKPVIKRK
jgi:hypothetical protein